MKSGITCLLIHYEGERVHPSSKTINSSRKETMKQVCKATDLETLACLY